MLADRVEEFARAEKCAYMKVCGRKGLKRMLTDWTEVKDKHGINLLKEL